MKPRIALVSREVYPLGGGGLGNYVTWAAAALADVAEVTVLTTAAHRDEYERLRAAADERLPAAVEIEFVEEPPGGHPKDWNHGSWFGPFHLWSARVFEALSHLYPDGGPDLAEFPDYHGEAAVSVQARRSSDPRLRNTCVCVRANTTSEICQVLDGRLSRRFDYRSMFDLERYALRHADRFVWPGGDVLGTYRRFYGADGLAPGARIPHAVARQSRDSMSVPPPSAPGPLRLLYAGRLERRKGVHNLLRALLDLDREDWELTVVGADTSTGPLGVSVRGQLEALAAGDERVRILERVSRERLAALIEEHHVCAVPSLWECWPNVALEALERGRPVLGTPTGGLIEIVKPRRSGWLSAGTSAEALGVSLQHLLDSREEVAGLAGEAPRLAFEELTNPAPIRERYLDLIAETTQTPRRPASGPPSQRLVSVVLTYFELEAYVEEAVASLFAQGYPEIEVLVVNDGSLREADRVLEELASRYPLRVVTQPNSGLSAARNFGIALSRGDYILPFDADDVAEPDLVARCVAALDGDPKAAYVATWSQFMHEDGRLVDDGYQPLGNESSLLGEQNVAGTAASMFRREVFDRFQYDPELPSYEDWFLFRQLREAGLLGLVIPERLFRYRVRPGSMLRKVGAPKMHRFAVEMETRLRERAVDWTAPDASLNGSGAGEAARAGREASP